MPTVEREIFAPVLFSAHFTPVVSGRIQNWTNSNVSNNIFYTQLCLDEFKTGQNRFKLKKKKDENNTL